MEAVTSVMNRAANMNVYGKQITMYYLQGACALIYFVITAFHSRSMGAERVKIKQEDLSVPLCTTLTSRNTNSLCRRKSSQYYRHSTVTIHLYPSSLCTFSVPVLVCKKKRHFHLWLSHSRNKTESKCVCLPTDLHTPL